jgi:hypothetical protein
MIGRLKLGGMLALKHTSEGHCATMKPHMISLTLAWLVQLGVPTSRVRADGSPKKRFCTDELDFVTGFTEKPYKEPADPITAHNRSPVPSEGEAQDGATLTPSDAAPGMTNAVAPSAKVLVLKAILFIPPGLL